MDVALSRLGGQRIFDVGLGDELGDRDAVFNEWCEEIYRRSCIASGIICQRSMSSIEPTPVRWAVVTKKTKTQGMAQGYSIAPNQ